MRRLRVLTGHLTDADLGEIGVSTVPTLAQVPGGDADQIINVPYEARTGVNREEYDRMYKDSIRDPNAFWYRVAQQFYWKKMPLTDHMSHNFDPGRGRVEIQVFKGGKTNVCFNCLDRNVLEGRGNQSCFLWEGNNPGDELKMTYGEVLEETCKLANWLKSAGVKKGQSVCIYMPLICQLPIAMLACARLGAIHSVVFGGFSAESLAQRAADCRAEIILTASAGLRGPKRVELKGIVDAACKIMQENKFKVKRVLVWEHKKAMGREETPMRKGRDFWWQAEVPHQSSDCPPEWMEAEDPLFLLYTSGSTGNPKGVVHSTGGYMVQAGISARYVFDLMPGDVYWCTADCGWITGHTYLTYGPLLNGATQVIYEGVPAFPAPDRIWQIVEKYKVRQFYSSPTLIRALEAHGEQWVQKNDLSSLRVLGTVGEPINPAAWNWYFKNVGRCRCPIVDTWWQTETGSILISGLPGAGGMKPGCATLPFFGVQPVLVDDKGKEMTSGTREGILAIKAPWPSMMRTLRGDHERFEQTYFYAFPGKYFTGDGARIDKDGYIWITGRVDDVINVSGHRVGTAEVEAALCSNKECIEAAVVGVDHHIKGQALYAYVTLQDGIGWNDNLKKRLIASVRSQIGAFAAPETLHLAPGLPKTRSGKIMRRVLRKIATKQEGELGDLSTLADPDTVKVLVSLRGK